MIKLYYHIYTSTHQVMSLMFIDQQLRRIKNSQIDKHAKINVFIHGAYHLDAANMVDRSGVGAVIRNCTQENPQNLGELYTIQHLYDEAEPDDRILYMHTKGIAYMCGEKNINGMTLPRNFRALSSWRWAMEYYLLDRWVERVNCFSLDPLLSVQGLLLNYDPFWNWNGNFWWSSGQHIRQLNPPTSLIDTYGAKMASRAFIMMNKPRNHNLFSLLDKPREDAHLGHTGYGTFRMHEDDCMPYVLEHRRNIVHPPIGPEHLLNT